MQQQQRQLDYAARHGISIRTIVKTQGAAAACLTQTNSKQRDVRTATATAQGTLHCCHIQ
jgi:hypothetical protein